MTDTKHTKGPWVVNYGEDFVEIYSPVTDDNDIQIAFKMYPDDTDVNNFLIMAAALEMKEEIQKQIEWLNHVLPQVGAPESVKLGFHQSIKALSRVLAKVEGK